MDFTNIDRAAVEKALKQIDKEGVPEKNKSREYNLVGENGKLYPPKYVVAVANNIANGVPISTEDFKAPEAVGFLQGLGYVIDKNESKENFQITITKDKVESTDPLFDIDNISHGDHGKLLDVYFERANGQIIRRDYVKYEPKNCGRTMPRLVMQIFEDQLDGLSKKEKLEFPICRYTKYGNIIKGIFSSVEEFKEHINTIEYLIYKNGNRQFVTYCWNIFSTLIFIQECLKRFGQDGDKVVMVYRYKTVKEENSKSVREENIEENEVMSAKGYKNKYSTLLIEARNIILRGAPGTGKSHLAQEIAADIVSGGLFDDYASLSEQQKEQIEFVQFHPNYDYTDFVEGLRPKTNDDGSVGFELRDGVFKRFVARARRNYEDSQKTADVLQKEQTAQGLIDGFLENVELGKNTYATKGIKTEFTITGYDENEIDISIPNNAKANVVKLSVEMLRRMIESGIKFNKVKDVTKFFNKRWATQEFSYYIVLYEEIMKSKSRQTKTKPQAINLKKYIFIIDEINRGEISKIFGELFFSIDPGYRGKSGAVSTQYANLHQNEEKFYVPENVYIIGTMNDIDRSVDSFDFAMRRRFRFVELKANECVQMLDTLEDEGLKDEAIKRMKSLNDAIAEVDGLNENYQIGAAYFLKLNRLDFDELWTDHLEPLLQDYVQGMYDEKGILQKLKKAYNLGQEVSDESDR